MFNSNSRRSGFAFILILGLLAGASVNASIELPSPINMMPVPATLQFGAGRLTIDPSFKISIHGEDDARLRSGLGRMLRRVEERTGITFPRTPTAEYIVAAGSADASFSIECAAAGSAVPVLGDDESYTLDVNPTRAVLRASTVIGALRGFETWLQLLQSDSKGWFVPAVKIQDQPRFPWRGLMIDVARHWQPMEVIKRNLDGMALVKLNVLHLHLTEDQGFRIESKKFPRLQQLGSDGHYFTQNEMREIIAYAAERGIRVVPEFDIPGHATSWVTAYPELASAPGPYSIERKWGVFDPVLDPTNPKVYELLDGFLGEMAALFPDAYIHIGGDENNGKQWNANPKIQAFIREHGLKDNAALHAYFNGRVHAILAKYGKRLIGWDEILHPDLPAGSVVQSWRGPQGIEAATKQSFPVILSNGYYIDLCRPTWEHYLNDPAPPDAKLTEAQRRLVLGGEATMWAEWVTPETIDSRIWPRTAAIAERLWSPVTVRDVPDMYRRLEIVSQRLEESGLRHESYLGPALRRLAGDGASSADLQALRSFVDLVEPVKNYQRGQQQPDANQFTPLTGVADCARPDSGLNRSFASQVDDVVVGHAASASAVERVREMLAAWNETATALKNGLLTRSPRLHDVEPVIVTLMTAAEVGRKGLDVLVSGKPPVADWLQTQLSILDQAAQPHGAVELPEIAPLKRLIVAVAEQSRRGNQSDDDWRQHIEKILNPPKSPTAKP
ncbi:MAG TPA: family 20 glycosylhydrolase [Lacunisphaera sp.]|jgi:hexosaminidase